MPSLNQLAETHPTTWHNHNCT